jgi:hypothetical protein
MHFSLYSLEKRRLGFSVSSRYLSWSLCKANLPKESYALDPMALDSRLKDAYSDYYSIKKSHTALCHSYLDTLAKALAEEQLAPKSRIIKKLKERELQ